MTAAAGAEGEEGGGPDKSEFKEEILGLEKSRSLFTALVVFHTKKVQREVALELGRGQKSYLGPSRVLCCCFSPFSSFYQCASFYGKEGHLRFVLGEEEGQLLQEEDCFP